MRWRIVLSKLCITAGLAVWLSVVGVAVGQVQDAASKDAASKDAASKDAITYKDHVLPILRKHCANCHNPDKATSDLNVMTYQALMAGGASGEAISPGKPDQSLLYRVVAHLDEPVMPQRQQRIPEVELISIKRWIE